MSARPPLYVVSPRAGGGSAHAPSTHGGFPPSTIPPRPASASTATSLLSSRTSTPPSTPPPYRPKRPLSAPRVTTTTAGVRPHTALAAAAPAASPSHRATSPRCRPASASRVRASYTTSMQRRTAIERDDDDDDVDTIVIPISGIDLPDQPLAENAALPIGERQGVVEDRPGTDTVDVVPDRADVAEAEKFLRAWQFEEASFRSPLLFAEASFAQAKAMTATGWPHPNVFLSSIALGSLEQFCQSLAHHHPFLLEAVDVLGSALFTNHRELRRAQLTPRGQHFCTAQMWHYMQHGQYCFQQLHAHEEQLETWRRAAQEAKRESQRLSEKLQKQHVAWLFERVQARAKTAAESAVPSTTRHSTEKLSYPQLRNVLFGGTCGARLDLQPDDYEFEPTAEEMLLVFNSLRPDEASKLLSMFHTNAAESQLPRLAEMYATAVDMLPSSERRRFLSEYFQLVESEELQRALQTRDETNREKQWATFLDEMKDVLRIQDAPGDSKSQFHSDEARVGASVYELVDLVEELATEVSLADDKLTFRLSPELVSRLKPYQSVKKRMEKAKQLMTAIPPDVPSLTESTACGCVCGKHRLLSLDDPSASTVDNSGQPARPDISLAPDDVVEADIARKRKSRGAQKRPSSAGKSGAKRKSTLTASARVSTRNSMANVRLFPLSEVCHLVSSVVQLQFARETGDAATTRRGSLRRSTRKSSDLSVIQRPSFRALAKDLLTRKYGIKSIAVLHMLQLEKSLVYFGATDKHVRCELFAWFIGADRTRSHYKDLAFQFYLRVARGIIAHVLKKPGDTVSYADLIAGWTEQIGDADTASGAVPPKTLSSQQCVEVCESVFPIWMKESAAFTLLVERLKVVTEAVDIEQFFKRILTAWETQFIRVHAQIDEIFTREAVGDITLLDFPLFRKCVAACGLDMTSGQLLEHYDALMGDDEGGVAIDKAIVFVIHQKHHS